jgi:hypothetical protein
MPNLERVTIALLAAGMEEQVAAEDELEGTESARYCETSDQLLAIIAREHVQVVVTQLRDARGDPVAPTLHAIHYRRPRLPIVAFLHPTPASWHDVPDALASGASEWSVRGHDHLGRVVRTALGRGWHVGIVRQLLAVLRAHLSVDLDEFAVACALKASPLLTAERIAEWVRVSERTLRARLQRLSLRPPSDFLEYGSAVHAAYLLDRLGLEAYRVVQDLGFADRRGLNRILRTYTGRSAREFRRHDTVDSVLQAAGESLRRPPLQNVLRTGVTMDTLDRYLAGDMTAEERLAFNQQLVDHPEAADFLVEIRRLIASANDPQAVQRSRRRAWERLVHELGGGS